MPEEKTERIAKIDIEYVNGSHLVIVGLAASAVAPVVVNAEQLLKGWKYPCRLLFTINIDPISGNIKPSVELAQ